MIETIECGECKRKPSEIDEYIYSSEEDGCTPEEYVMFEEGTYNPIEKKFYCTECYIKNGSPKGIWVKK